MYIWHMYSGNEVFGSLFLESKYLALVDSRFQHSGLILLLQACFDIRQCCSHKRYPEGCWLSLWVLTHRKWMWKQLGFISLRFREMWQIPQGAPCAKGKLHTGIWKDRIVFSSGNWAVAKTGQQVLLCSSPCCLFLSPCNAHGAPWLLRTPRSAVILALASPVRHSGIVLMMLTTLVGKRSSWQQLQAPCLLLLNSTNEINLLSASVPLQPHSRAYDHSCFLS